MGSGGRAGPQPTTAVQPNPPHVSRGPAGLAPRAVGSAGELLMLLPLALQLSLYVTHQRVTVHHGEATHYGGLLPTLYVTCAAGCGYLCWSAWPTSSSVREWVERPGKRRELLSRSCNELSRYGNELTRGGLPTLLLCGGMTLAMGLTVIWELWLDSPLLTAAMVVMILAAAVLTDLLLAQLLVSRIFLSQENDGSERKRERTLRWRRLFLSTVPLFSHIYTADLIKIAESLTVVSVPIGTELLTQGHTVCTEAISLQLDFHDVSERLLVAPGRGNVYPGAGYGFGLCRGCRRGKEVTSG